MAKNPPKNLSAITDAANPNEGKLAYEAPLVLEVFKLEALAVVCSDSNAKNEVALGCNPGALFS